MMKTLLISDLKDGFSEIEEIINFGDMVCLTEDGRKKYLVLNFDCFLSLNDNIELKLEEADIQAESSAERLNHEELVSQLREYLLAKKVK